MKNGNKPKIGCTRNENLTENVQRKTTDKWWMWCCGSCAQALHGVVLPEYYGPWPSVYTQFRWWEKIGWLDDMLKTLSVDPDAEGLLIDATITAYTHMVQAQKGAASRSHGTIMRRVNFQDSCDRRCSRHSIHLSSNGWKHPWLRNRIWNATTCWREREPPRLYLEREAHISCHP